MAHIYKQFLINQLNLPRELLDIIKDYTFYNKEQSMIKSLKMQCIDTIKNTSTRANSPVMESEFWAFISLPNTMWMNGYNCFTCGNYKHHTICNRIQCQCVNDDTFDIMNNDYEPETQEDLAEAESYIREIEDLEANLQRYT